MSSTAAIADDLRARIIDEPTVILDDPDLMRALVAANDKMMGDNIVDLRGIAMERLEARLDRLEETHRSVIAAAYENLAGTNQIHRAVLRLLEAPDFETLLSLLDDDLAATLRVDCVRLVLETDGDRAEAARAAPGDAVRIMSAGFARSYAGNGTNRPPRRVVLRRTPPHCEQVYGAGADALRSEAVLTLDLGEARQPALLALGSADAQQFTPNQGTDLMDFFAGAVERVLRRWLA
ncbi:uncharacterized protein YigA (DUF484 family) [Rhodovulum sulfidophilum]|uniref:DUF484 family protein n=1 Tax=Rhodovulum sulfidophilum TaxID=35806 RepID=UPI0005AB930D|nr:DUF484 family protein [Rhodovulum sulfidophilum]ANB35548.1 recombinase XerC [Rhodovulum sulfidophilum DSM 1374]ANB39369.1 recombinase XerC [Rhodovulum sulfidophilum]MCW2302635.1 uncharacterized protein YigA (DUF484 family) [Rhodovulum sulfidophilum]